MIAALRGRFGVECRRKMWTGCGSEMIRNNRLIGLMAGITVGFAAWGSGRLPPREMQQAAVTASGEMQQAATEVSGKMQQTAEESGPKFPASLKNLHAQSAVLMDADSGRILFGKNENVSRPMASTTKIMTCILALENASPDTVCSVSAIAASQPKVRLGAPKGSEFFLKDLLYSLMLESHNDSAVMIAEAVAGSVENFAGQMNRKARGIGCRDTYFLTPNGLDAAKTMPDGTEQVHTTTAADLARIMRYCMTQSPAKEQFLEITQTMDYSFSDRSGRQYYSCTNHNALLSMLPGLLSGKTGFTGGAGYCYVGAYENDGRRFILALLGCGWPPHKTWKWSDARTLFFYASENYRQENIFRPQPDVQIAVTDGIADHVTVRARSTELGEQEYRVLLSGQDRVEVKTQLPDTLTAPVRAGEIVGKTTYFLNGEELKTDRYYAVENIGKRDYPYCLVQILQKFLPTKMQLLSKIDQIVQNLT
jgi:D-alanyl-D-alanine carboxypeptidase (penicillin-binding protein 5/6)